MCINRVTNRFHDLAGIVQDRFTAFNIIGSAEAAGGIQHGRHRNIVGLHVLDVLDATLRHNGGPTLTHGSSAVPP